MNYESLFMKNTPIPKENLIKGVWYTLDTGGIICFESFTKDPFNKKLFYNCSSYIGLMGYRQKYGRTTSKPISLTDPDILAKYGLYQPCLIFSNKEIIKINEFTDFYNKLKFKI